MTGRRLAEWPGREGSMDEFSPEKAPSRLGMWSIAFASNLVVPLLIGWMVTQQGGRIGMVAGIGLLWYLGYRVCVASDGCGRALVIGGILVAATQFCPILPVFAGLMGLGVAERLWPESFVNMGTKTELGGFIATVVMGLVMMGVAAVIGSIANVLFPRRPRVSPAPASHLYDRQLDG
jgi:hypothetical protein